MLNEYQLNRQDFHKIWAAFQQIDKQNDGYITVNQLMSFLSEREYSICSPYIHRFFLLIDKDVEVQATLRALRPSLQEAFEAIADPNGALPLEGFTNTLFERKVWMADPVSISSVV